MAETSSIEWTDFTLNFWEGCQKVGPGCDNCYAEARDIRFTGGSHWGPGAPRRKVKGAVAKLRQIIRGAGDFHARHGRHPRIFCQSLSDFFDNAVPDEWREEAQAEIASAYDCRFQILTKRVGNVERLLSGPGGWLRDGGRGWPENVGLMITVVNQAEADRDIPKLLALKAKFGIPWVGLSMEPLLGPVDIVPYIGGRSYLCACGWQRTEMRVAFQGERTWCFDCGEDHRHFPTLDWIVVGGESGLGARPMHPDWARSLRDQCAAAGTAFFFKQMSKKGTIPADLVIREFPNER